MIPYFSWCIIAFMLNRKYSISSFSQIILYPDHYYWFLWVLFFIWLIFSYIQRVSFHLQFDETKLILLACPVLAGLMMFFNIRIFGIQYITYYFLFYSLGYLMHKYNFVVNRRMLIIVSFIAWLLLAWNWSMHDIPSWVPVLPYIPTGTLQYFYRFMTATVAILFLMNFFEKYMNSLHFLNNSLSKLGKISLGVYITHLFLVNFLKDFFINMDSCMSNALLSIILFVIVTPISICIVQLIQKNKLLSYYLLGR